VYRFSGLPGLILEVSDNEKEYNFRLNSISKTDDKIKLSNSVKLLSLEELNKLKVKIYKDPAGILRQKLATMSSEGMSIGVKFNGESISNKDLVERMESDYLEFFRKYNNPLEKNDIWLR
ncbi:MAG: hypothetical protein Q4C75_02520, partial [Bergeyella zoohelcum]|nr:hypothetical protein [Bergeyella zoohelcum]